MRKDSLEMVLEFARRDPRVVFVGSDLGAGVLDAFRREMPDRFFMEGVSEANVVGMAAGLAAEGHVVYANTLAVFFSRRAYEQVALDLCLHKLRVRLIANGGGLVYAPLGPTHMAIEDIGLMRMLPNMAVVAPADARELRRIMPLTHDLPGPVYIRLGKGNEPDVTPETVPSPFNAAVPVSSGSGALLVTTGVMLHTALAARDILAREGISAALVHCPVVKPLDMDALRAAIESVPAVVTIEENVGAGGLGSAVAELLAESQWNGVKRFARFHLPDEFPDHYGSQAQLFEQYGITPESIAARVSGLLQDK